MPHDKDADTVSMQAQDSANSLLIRTFGDVYIRRGRDSKPLLAPPRVQNLLIYLAVQERPLTREQLCDLFWPELPYQKAQRNLRKLLFDCQHLLFPYFNVEREWVGLTPAYTYSLDAAIFQRRGQSLLQAYEGQIRLPPKELHQLQEVLNLYQGSFLASSKLPHSIRYEQWVQQQQELHYNLAYQLFDMVRAQLLQSQRLQEALQIMRAWLSIDPYNEQEHNALLLLLSRLGQHIEAIKHYETYRHFVTSTLGDEPAAHLQTLYAQLQVGWLPEESLAPVSRLKYTAEAAPAPIARSSAPQAVRVAPLTPLLGRDELLQHIIHLVQSTNHRLLTLTGLGGSGKSHLALTLAQQMSTYFADAVYLIRCAEAALPAEKAGGDEAQLHQTLTLATAQALHLPLHPDRDSWSQLVAHLQQQQTLLLIYDNFDPFIDGATFLLRLYQMLPQITIVITVRERLRLCGATVIVVPGLPTLSPETILHQDGYQRLLTLHYADDARPLPAPLAGLQLFIDRAHRQFSTFQVTAEMLPDIAKICCLVDGLPLAIEMAAAWIEHYACREIAERLQADLLLLQRREQDGSTRQQSMEAILTECWRRLTTCQQHVLRALATFEGAFSREVAQTIDQVSLPVLQALVDKSLLQVRLPGTYELHALVKHFLRTRILFSHPS